MSSKHKGKLSRCGRGERLIGSGRNVKPSVGRAKKANARPQPNNDDSSIVSLTSSTQTRDKKDEKNKPKPELSKEAPKDGNSMLSTDLYPTRDSEAEKVILAELKNARVPRDDQSTDEIAMQPIIVSESNFNTYGKGAPGRLKVRTKSRLKDDRAPRCSRERLPKGATKPPKPKRDKIKSTRGGIGGAASDSPEECMGKDLSGSSSKKDSLGCSKPQVLHIDIDRAMQKNDRSTIPLKCDVEIKVDTKGPSKPTAVQPLSKEVAAKDPSIKDPVPKIAQVKPLQIKDIPEVNIPDSKTVSVKLPQPKDVPVNPISKEEKNFEGKDTALNPAATTDPPVKATTTNVVTSGPEAPGNDQKSKEPVACMNSNIHIFLCKKCGKAKDRFSVKKTSKRKKENELFNRDIERIKANMKRIEILSRPITFPYCESSSSFSISSRIELSE